VKDGADGPVDADSAAGAGGAAGSEPWHCFSA